MSKAKQFQPLAAAGKPITPVDALPTPPTLIVNAAAPLFVVMDGLVPNPDEIVGAVPVMRTLVVWDGEKPAATSPPVPVYVAVVPLSVINDDVKSACVLFVAFGMTFEASADGSPAASASAPFIGM